MINSIHIADEATYGHEPEIMDGLARFNYVYGANATGKTTISRIIDDEKSFPSCTINWKGGSKLETLVYNTEFVRKNFEQSKELKGVFTLGEKSKEIVQRINTTKSERDELDEEIIKLKYSLEGEDGKGGKIAELVDLEEYFKQKCWAQKQKHDEKLQGAFEGYRNNAERFKEKVLHESKENKAPLVPLEELVNKAETIFGETPTTKEIIPNINAEKLLNHENNSILKKRVIGKEDVDIAALIKKLDNSDWVKQGLVYYDTETKTCPFCQQKTNEKFAQSLNEYFDETYEADNNAINDLMTDYGTKSERLIQEIEVIVSSTTIFLDIEALKKEKQILDSKISVNEQLLAEKKKEPSKVVELESLSNVIAKINEIINNANSKIKKHNETVANISQEREELKGKVWKYLIENELKVDLELYREKKDDLDKAIDSLNEKINKATQSKNKKVREIEELEKQITSIQPTVDAINKILSSFGFNGFSLAKAEDDISYKIIRSDGSDAKETLSEGERAFVTFLYFYYLLRGSQTESGITNDRVVVFDDPVSSFDSDVLFVVSNLIKSLIDEVRTNQGSIKQIFVLTHNVYFHREVTFNPNRRDKAMKEETFWVVRKSGGKSKIAKHDSNPIKTSYELLWSEIRNPDLSNLMIQNTLRRILENYFTILGGVDPDQICNKFAGQDRIICNSLFSWVHAGSHIAQDDLYISSEGMSIDNYLNVFKDIFEKTGHIAHYKMMMGHTENEDDS